MLSDFVSFIILVEISNVWIFVYDRFLKLFNVFLQLLLILIELSNFTRALCYLFLFILDLTLESWSLGFIILQILILLG